MLGLHVLEYVHHKPRTTGTGRRNHTCENPLNRLARWPLIKSTHPRQRVHTTKKSLSKKFFKPAQQQLNNAASQSLAAALAANVHSLLHTHTQVLRLLHTQQVCRLVATHTPHLLVGCNQTAQTAQTAQQ